MRFKKWIQENINAVMFGTFMLILILAFGLPMLYGRGSLSENALLIFMIVIDLILLAYCYTFFYVYEQSSNAKILEKIKYVVFAVLVWLLLNIGYALLVFILF